MNIDYKQIRKIVREEIAAFDEEKTRKRLEIQDELNAALLKTQLMMLKAQRAPINEDLE